MHKCLASLIYILKYNNIGFRKWNDKILFIGDSPSNEDILKIVFDNKIDWEIRVNTDKYNTKAYYKNPIWNYITLTNPFDY